MAIKSNVCAARARRAVSWEMVKTSHLVWLKHYLYLYFITREINAHVFKQGSNIRLQVK